MVTTTAVAKITPAQIMHDVIVKGDLKELGPEQRVQYYASVCESLGINP